MDKLKKFGLMEKIVHELEDLKNSQQAIIQKLAKIEVDNMDLGDKRLEKDLPDMHQRVPITWIRLQLSWKILPTKPRIIAIRTISLP
jgi:uncharacterized protein Yka (UPF0111/DUF47 family)